MEVLGEEQRKAERQDELDRRDRDGPDQPDLERVDEEVVVDELAEVVEPDEVRRDVEAGAGIGEGEVDAACEREDAQDHDRAGAPGSRGTHASLDEMPLPALLRPRRGASGRRLLRRAHAPAPDEARTTSVGSTPTTRGSASEPSIRAEQQLGGDAGALGGARGRPT